MALEQKANDREGRSQQGRKVVKPHVRSVSGQVVRTDAVATDRIARLKR